jgi:hypothetical protein
MSLGEEAGGLKSAVLMGVDANSISIAAPINERTGFIPYSSPARNSGSFVIDLVPTAVGEPPGLGPQPIVSILCGVNRPFQSFGDPNKAKDIPETTSEISTRIREQRTKFSCVWENPAWFSKLRNRSKAEFRISKAEVRIQETEFRNHNPEGRTREFK